MDGHLDFNTAPGLCSSILLYDHRGRTDYQRRGAQDGHLDFHTDPGLCSLVLLYVHRDRTDY